MQIHHRFIGNPRANKVIVFLHEGLGSVEQWKNFPTVLCAATNAFGFLYDRAGFGKSHSLTKEREVNYMSESAKELDSIIEKFIPKTYDIYLYGHSDGGTIALIYASLYPQKIKAILTEAAHVFVEDITIEGIKKIGSLFQSGKMDGLKKYHGEQYKAVFMNWYTIWLDPLFRKWDITDLLKNIICPQLIIQGVDDEYGTLKQTDTIASKTAGDTTLFILEKCGHSPHKQHERATLLKTTLFINGF